MKLKFFAVLMVVLGLSSCGAMNDFNGLFSDKEVAGAIHYFLIIHLKIFLHTTP